MIKTAKVHIDKPVKYQIPLKSANVTNICYSLAIRSAGFSIKQKHGKHSGEKGLFNQTNNLLHVITKPS